jgi:hypothetical protein
MFTLPAAPLATTRRRRLMFSTSSNDDGANATVGGSIIGGESAAVSARIGGTSGRAEVVVVLPVIPGSSTTTGFRSENARSAPRGYRGGSPIAASRFLPRAPPPQQKPVVSAVNPRAARDAALSKLSLAEAADNAVDQLQTLNAVEDVETTARARGVPVAEAKARAGLYAIDWACMLIEVHSAERRRAILDEGLARDDIVVDEAYRLDLILDVWHRQTRSLNRRLEAAADDESRRANLAMASVRFGHNVQRRLHATLEADVNATEAQIFVVPRAQLRAAAEADLLDVEEQECALRRDFETAWLDGHSELTVALTATVEGAA